MSPHLPGDCGSWKWPSHSYVVFASLFPGLVEQGGVKIEPLPKEVRVYLLTTSRAPYCGEQGGKRNTCSRGRLGMSRLPTWVACSPAQESIWEVMGLGRDILGGSLRQNQNCENGSKQCHNREDLGLKSISLIAFSLSFLSHLNMCPTGYDSAHF